MQYIWILCSQFSFNRMCAISSAHIFSSNSKYTVFLCGSTPKSCQWSSKTVRNARMHFALFAVHSNVPGAQSRTTHLGGGNNTQSTNSPHTSSHPVCVCVCDVYDVYILQNVAAPSRWCRDTRRRFRRRQRPSRHVYASQLAAPPSTTHTTTISRYPRGSSFVATTTSFVQALCDCML